ncbi:MAG: hypothetical protein IT424_14370 [Pirellulales bacterium]|nr:hypothetical protein [Pirellulales bacterium]
MATDFRAELSEAELLHLYLERRFEKGQRGGTLDDVMAGFAEYRRQLKRIRELVREAEESFARFGSQPLDLDAMWAELDLQFDAEGIPE